ncbi:iron-containing redox enzyme family protein [Massilia sp. DWR3-1-1]|uniref:iron-containing redox enzyme family protein n=1 Tax=Massilia sp. DWR3-1-1 TaxID=2804559 RepID=UPI003CE922FA
MSTTCLDVPSMTLPANGGALPSAAVPALPVRDLYVALRERPALARADGAAWLHGQIAAARALGEHVPADLSDLDETIAQHTQQVGLSYRTYLGERKAGAPRRYFPTRSHALHFLKAVGPTKLVDGAWLYGILAHWNDPRFLGLIRTYLEELGDGVPAKNHVALFQKLLKTHAIDDWQGLDDSHFVQGAIQLALAHNAEAFLPEIIGFNLGYEQLPLHLLICAYELNELGIDPMYFTLHVTIDNADCGHARKAAQAVRDLLPQLGDRADFLRRVGDGYRLNALGASTLSVIDGFDLDDEVLAIMMSKSRHGQNMHSDYCRVAGRSINDWLATPEQMPALLAALVKAGWIERGQAADQSRFWRLIQGPNATMFGVFSDYEQQVLRDWIESEQVVPPRRVSHRSQVRALEQLAGPQERPAAPRAILRSGGSGGSGPVSDLHLLEQRIADMPSRDEAMEALRTLMAPQLHAGPVGLMATRLFARLLAL